MMKKILMLLLTVALCAGALASCAPEDSGNVGDNGGTQTPPVAEGTVLWSKALVPTIIVSDQDGFNFENQLATHIFDVTGNIPEVRPSIGEGVAREISLGNTGSALSVKAYNRLDDLFNLSLIENNGDSAWLILASEGKIAIAYTDTFAKKAAVDHIAEKLTSETYSPQNGVVAKGSFKTIEYLRALREEFHAPMFAEVASKLGEAASAALKKLYSLYDEDLYVWFANLYCPDVGGFYYSASARDNEGFLPDLESTAQGLGMLERSGLAAAYDDNWTRMIPYEISENILAFAKGLQDEDGWFYHPQWGTGISDSRRGRDSGWAKDIIKAMGSTPNYIYATDRVASTVSAKSLTVLLENSSAAVAVSKVVATAADNSKYESEEAFIDYLDSLKISENSYSAGNALNSTSGMITKHGLRDVLNRYLIEHQNPDNGLWEDEISYQSVNGLMKLCSFFGSNFPNAEKAMDSAIQILKRPLEDEITGITFVYNPWYAIHHLLSAVSEDTKKELRTMLHENAEDIFKMTFEKLGAFAKPDGGFSYGREFSAPYSQEALVAVSGSVESDVNATSIAVTTVVEYVSNVYGFKFPTIFCEYDSIHFLNTLAKMDTIIKNRVEDPVVDTFDDFDPDDGQIDGNVVMRPGDYINNKVGDGDGDNYGYKWFESSIVPNPAPGADPKDMVLYVADKVYPDEEKSIANEASSTEFKISNFSVPGNSYVFETDMWIKAVEDTAKPVAQLTFVREGSALISSWVDFYQYKRFGQNYVRIQDYSASFAGADGVRENELASGIPVEEWFKLRVELYKDYSGESGELTVYMKIYINGELASVSDTGHYDAAKGAYKDFVVSAIRLSYYRHSASSFYLNNVYAAKSGVGYLPESGKLEPDSEISDGKHIYDFEDGIPNSDKNFTEMFYKDEDRGMVSINAADWTAELDEKYATVGGAKITAVADPRNSANKVLKAYSYNTKTSSYKATMYVDDTQLAAGGKTYEIEFDYYFERIAWLFSGDFFSVNLQDNVGASLASVTFTSTDFADNHNTATALGIRVGQNLLENVKVKYDRWYTFRMVYYYNPDLPAESRMVIYVLHEGEYVCISNEILPCKVGEPARVGLTFHCYDIRGTQYIDDLSVSRTDAQYTHVAPSPEIMYEIPIQGDDNVYVTESSRGEGVYASGAISYTNATYGSLIGTQQMAKNTARGDGTELTDKVSKIVRSIAVEKVDNDDAFVYTTLGSGNHAVNFVSKAPAYNGFIFETDIKLSGVDSFSGRDIRFTGTTSNGAADAGLWAFNVKLCINFNEDVGGYLITVANSDKVIGIPDDTWVNIRMEAKGIDKGSDLVFYVNGVEMITTTLSDSIKGIKGVELFTPATYSGHGWEKGSISLDNTYVSGTGTPPPTTEITESSRGEGKYAGEAIKYDGRTYSDLVKDGFMSENAFRGDGVHEHKRELEVDNDHLRYASLGSGNHAFKFLSRYNAVVGYIFETDILLSGVDTTESRAIFFVGSSSDGANDGHLNAFKINIYANPEKEGTYVIFIPGVKDRVVVNDNSWTNLRLEAHGLSKDDELELFVNGKSVIKSTLTADIKSIKSVELYTPSTYGGHGWEKGEILLDNTYATGVEKTYDEITSVSRGESADRDIAITYDGVTYDELIADGRMYKNTYRKDGVDALNRLLEIVDVNGDKALKYTSIGNGIHSLDFAVEGKVESGIVFDTDFMLDGVDTSADRPISFIGTSKNGTANVDVWSFRIDLYANPSSTQGGYVLAVKGSTYQVCIPDKAWVNLRVEYEGIGNGSKFNVFINGEKVADGTLGGSIASMTAVELFTQSNNGSQHGWQNGSIYLDNTCIYGVPAKSESDNPTIPDGNLDGDGWDK